MSAEDAYLMFEAMAEIHGTTDLLKKIAPDQKQREEEETACEVKEASRERMAPFTFDMVDIVPGEEIEFWATANTGSGIMCKVVDGKHIEVNGEIYSLTAFAKKMLQVKYSVAGPRFFKYRGEWLIDLRDRMAKQEEY